MRGILADINAGKHVKAIISVWTSDAWREIWNHLGLTVTSFPAQGLSYNASDVAIWRTCQREGLVLITGNRNDDGPDSLESAVRDENLPESLPIVTISDPDRLLRDRLYTEKVAERLLEYLFAIDDVRGAGRLFVP
jgi:hypothetical protein